MSALDEKLKPPEPTRNDRAQATAKQLMKRWGCEPFDPKKVELVFVRGLGTGRTELWKRIGGPGGVDTVYEFRDEMPTTEMKP